MGLTVRVCHHPPGTSKWNTIEHKLFSYSSINWRARPLTSMEAVMNPAEHVAINGAVRHRARVVGIGLAAGWHASALPNGQIVVITTPAAIYLAIAQRKWPEMYHGLGRQSGRVYKSLRSAIVKQEYAPGGKLPSHTSLAVQFGVSPVTVRQAIATLSEEGLLDRQQGRGTFVRRAKASPAVLIVDDDPDMRALLAAYTVRAGHAVLEAGEPGAALTLLEANASIALVLSDVRMPDIADGVEFIRTVRQRWPGLPLAAITGYPDDLARLHGTPECPVLILAKPVWEQQVLDVFRWVLGGATAPKQRSSSPG